MYKTVLDLLGETFCETSEDKRDPIGTKTSKKLSEKGTSFPIAPFSEQKTFRFASFPSLAADFVESSRKSWLKNICRY